jgi:Cu/Ag efflux pump CusA
VAAIRAAFPDLHFDIEDVVVDADEVAVSVQNGLIMVSQFNALRAQGLPLADAVRQGAEDRFLPVLMTVLVASLGFVPMALASGVGAEIYATLSRSSAAAWRAMG